MSSATATTTVEVYETQAFAIDLIVAWMDPRAAEAGTRSSAVGRVA